MFEVILIAYIFVILAFAKETVIFKKVSGEMEIMEELEIPDYERGHLNKYGLLELNHYLKKCRGKPIVRIESGIAFIPKKVYCEKDTAVSDKEQKN